MSSKRIRIGVACLLAAALLLGIPGQPLFATANAKSSGEIQDEIDDLENKEQELQNQIDALKAQMSENLADIQAIVDQKLVIEQQVSLLYLQTVNINDQIASYNMLIADQQEALEAAEETLAQLNVQYKERIRAMEEGGTLSYWQVLLASQSFVDFLDRLYLLSEIASADQHRLEQMNAAADEVAAIQKNLEAEKAQLQATRDELTKAQENMDQKNAEAQSLMNQLLAKGEEYERHLAESHERQDKLLDEIAKKEQEYTEAIEEEEYLKWLAAQDPNFRSPLGGNTDENGIYWAMPVQYSRVSSPFNPNRLHPVLGIVRPHKGIDLSAPSMTPIYASRGGVVTVASTGEETGNYVYINHGDGFSTGYLHMTYYVVTAGQWVSTGQLIGYVGSTGLSTGPHLHFAVVKDGTYVNPALYLDFY